jgi:putative (di)nucleoside polyphosphate hydrolase
MTQTDKMVLTPTHDDIYYRPGVGITLFNKQGLVFVGERLDNLGAWQLPQGGIDEGEDMELAVFREMEEEIGTRNAKILGMIEEWIYYDIPPATARKLWDNKYRGQRQKWIALEFLGDDSDIKLDAFSHPEFGRWQWVPLHELLTYAVPFKRDVYQRVMESFACYADHCKQDK